MKIGFDAKRYFYNRSGLGNYSRNIVSYLTENYSENYYFLFKPNTKNTLEFKLDKTVKVVEPELNKSSIKNSIWRSKGILKENIFNSLDVFHGLSNELPIGISKTKVKSILTVHDLIFLRFPELYKPIDRKIYLWKMKKSCDEADKILAISEQTKRDLIVFLGIYPEKIDVVYQGCSEIYFNQFSEVEKEKVRLKYSLPKDFILNVGTIEPRKNALLIVKALKNAKIKAPLVLLGKKTSYSEKIKAFVNENKMQNQVYFLHDVDFYDLPAIYQCAKIFVYPSFFEGFGIPIIEAYNSGVPTITSDIAIFKEVAGNATLFFENNNIESLSEKLLFLLENENEQKKYIELGYKRADFYKGEKIATDLMEVYKSVL